MIRHIRSPRRPLCALAVIFALSGIAFAQKAPESAAGSKWIPSGVTRTDYLDAVERLVRFLHRHQDGSGAIIDPILKREHQYSTPYYAHALGTLLDAGRADDLRDSGIAAMDHATACVGGGNAAIPDQHGEFFIAPLTEALALYRDHAPPERVAEWSERMRTPLLEIIEGLGEKTNNWRTYAMKGEWLRAKAGLVSRDVAVAFIEDAWLNRTQRERIVADAHNLYQDWNGHPQSHAVEAVGRGNLLALANAGYDGPSAAEIADAVHRGTTTTLLLQSPDGQCPPNGRTDNHVFNDVLYLLSFEAEAERLHAEDESERAGEYRRAAALAFRSIGRWLRDDKPWDGMYSITKNHFDPADRVGYQPASQVSNYTATVAYHLAEAYHARQTDIEERPAPCEVGGFAFTMDAKFGSAVANAGGMQLFANLEGDSVPKYGMYWTPLGVVRFARAGWDARLGPSDGAFDAEANRGVTFGPTWKERGRWVRLAEKARDYRGTFTVEQAEPDLVKCAILYAPVTGVGGPAFKCEFAITPHGIGASISSPHSVEFGVTLPVLMNDGRDALEVSINDRIVRTKYPDAGDEQCYILLNDDGSLEESEPVLSTYGLLKPVRAQTSETVVQVYVYPRKASEPDPKALLDNVERAKRELESI